jgi:hypothetical protein
MGLLERLQVDVVNGADVFEKFPKRHTHRRRQHRLAVEG